MSATSGSVASARRRVAIIGLGMAVGPHARSLVDLGGRIEVAAAYTPSPARRAAFARQFPFPLVDRIEAILEDPTITAVGILTPPATHLDLARRAADAGKHILLEKPLEITTARAEALVAHCEAKGVTLGTVLQHRFRPAGRRAAEIIREGRLGRIVSCATSIRLWRPQSYYDEPGRGTRARDGGGVLMTQGIHTLDLMLSLAGPIAEVRSFVTTTPVHRMETEDLVCAAVRYASGAHGVIDATTAAYPGFHERIEIAGEKGSLRLAGTELELALADGTRETIAADQSAGGTGADPMAFPHHYHRAVWEDFLDAIDERRSAKISGREALNVHRLIDALIVGGAVRGA